MKFLFLMMILISTSFVSAETIKVEVNGMVCSMCAQGIEKKFKKLDVVKTIKVDLDTKVVQIELLENQSLDDQTVTKFITESGYNVGAISREK